MMEVDTSQGEGVGCGVSGGATRPVDFREQQQRSGARAGRRRARPRASHRGERLVLLLELVVGRGERLLRRVQLVVGLLQLLLQGAQLLLGLQERTDARGAGRGRSDGAARAQCVSAGYSPPSAPCPSPRGWPGPPVALPAPCQSRSPGFPACAECCAAHPRPSRAVSDRDRDSALETGSGEIGGLGHGQKSHSAKMPR